MDDQTPLLQSLYPLYAPLPVPMVEHLLIRLMRAKRASSPSMAWDVLRNEVQEKREMAFFSMDPFVQPRSLQRERHIPREGAYSTAWLLQTLTNHTPDKVPILQDTLSKWHKRGLVRYREHGVPDYDSAAALFLVRMIDRGERNFLPSRIKDEEPYWWCWRQDTPTAPVIPCPVPLPPSLPPSALLWTDWAGASWSAPWVKIGASRGAIRWAGVMKIRQEQERWALTTADLTRWDQEAAALLNGLPLLDEANQKIEELERMHDVATSVLRRLAAQRFTRQPRNGEIP
jgi:hypothetical protein